MSNSYAALGEQQTRAHEEVSHQKGLVLLSFFIGMGCAVAWAGQQLAVSSSPINAMSYMQATKAFRSTAPLAYQPPARSMATPLSQLAPAMEHVIQRQHGSSHPFRNMRVHAENPKIDGIIEQLKTLTLFEAADLVKETEAAFGVSAAAGMVMAGPGGGGGGGAAAEAAEEKTDFDVILEAVDEKKRVAALKVVRGITGLGLKETKDFMSALPKALKEGATKEECETMKKELEAIGAKVSIK